MIVFFFDVSLFNRAKGFLMRVFFTGPLRRILKEESNLFRQVHLFSFLYFPFEAMPNFRRKRSLLLCNPMGIFASYCNINISVTHPDRHGAPFFGAPILARTGIRHFKIFVSWQTKGLLRKLEESWRYRWWRWSSEKNSN
jgi:hypothetical protein